MMATVILHGDAALGRSGGMDAEPIPGNTLATVACIEGSILLQFSVQFSLYHNVIHKKDRKSLRANTLSWRHCYKKV